MNQNIAAQVARLLNTQNQLTRQYDATHILNHAERYIIRVNDKEELQGCIEVKKVQWYQCEIDHLSVHPDALRKGLGTDLLLEAESKAKKLGACVAQCTIRVGNIKSEGLFKKNGYVATVTFINERNKNQVTVYQKVLS